MKILKQEDISNWEYKCKCSGCNTELLAERSDLVYERYPRDKNEPINLQPEGYHICCMVCNRQIVVDSINIPRLMQVQFRLAYENDSRNKLPILAAR